MFSHKPSNVLKSTHIFSFFKHQIELCLVLFLHWFLKLKSFNSQRTNLKNIFLFFSRFLAARLLFYGVELIFVAVHFLFFLVPSLLSSVRYFEVGFIPVLSCGKSNTLVAAAQFWWRIVRKRRRHAALYCYSLNSWLESETRVSTLSARHGLMCANRHVSSGGMERKINMYVIFGFFFTIPYLLSRNPEQCGLPAGWHQE